MIKRAFKHSSIDMVRQQALFRISAVPNMRMKAEIQVDILILASEQINVGVRREERGGKKVKDPAIQVISLSYTQNPISSDVFENNRVM